MLSKISERAGDLVNDVPGSFLFLFFEFLSSSFD